MPRFTGKLLQEGVVVIDRVQGEMHPGSTLDVQYEGEIEDLGTAWADLVHNQNKGDYAIAVDGGSTWPILFQGAPGAFQTNGPPVR